MSDLIELVNSEKTDKNTIHSYLPVYELLLKNKKNTCKNVIEVGIKDGGSIKLWHDYFINAKIHALDICSNDRIWEGIKDKERIILYPLTDAYNEDLFKINFIDKNIKLDMALDDGPHSLESMKQFITMYSPILSDIGILIIEDVQDMSWLEQLTSVVPEELKQFVSTYDLRHIKNRYDDIVFVINKNKND
jgi:hypothetical protein